MPRPRKVKPTVAALDKRRQRVRDADPGYLQWRTRREKAQAQLREIELAERNGRLMTLDDFERAVGDAFGRVRAKLLNLPARAAQAAVGAQTIGEALLRIEPVVREVMDELRRADDVPELDE